MKADYSSILCVADMNITDTLDKCLEDLALPEVFVQRAKQMCLLDKQGFLGLRPVTKFEENRALIYRINVPPKYEEGVINHIIETTDLELAGRGSIFAQPIVLHRSEVLSFDTEKLEKLCGNGGKLPHEEHVLLTCILPRGMGDSVARAILDQGVCVPIAFFGAGVGLRDKLGLMRITVPVEKEVLWFAVPRSDATHLEKTLIARARLDIPARGFLYKFFIHAPVVNLRVRHGKQVHAATMEQVITALDEVRGSSEWRRFGSRKSELFGKTKSDNNRALFFIGEEEEVEAFRRTAMENGARGATLNELEMRSYTGKKAEQVMESHSRLLCDIVTSRAIEEKLLETIAKADLFKSGKSWLLKTFDVELSSVIRR
jgi:hypothetical protein